MPAVSFARSTYDWTVRGEDRRTGQSGELLLTLDDLPFIPVREVRAGLKKWSEIEGTSAPRVEVSLLPAEHFDADGPTHQIHFELQERGLAVKVLCSAPWPESGDESEVEVAIKRLVAPLLNSKGATSIEVTMDDWYSSSLGVMVTVKFIPRWRGRTMADLFKDGDDVLSLCAAYGEERVDRDSVADLVRGGGAHLLIGQPEGNWLDAKSEEYDLTSAVGRIRLAQAVARFANAETGGLIVVGAKAKKVPGGEVIRAVPGVVPRSAGSAARYLQVLNQNLYPPPHGLRIDVVPTQSSRSIIAIDIPPQPEELKPFLVHGAVVENGVEGAFISLVQRRGEGSLATTAPMIHAQIAAGRALLRGATQNS